MCVCVVCAERDEACGMAWAAAGKYLTRFVDASPSGRKCGGCGGGEGVRRRAAPCESVLWCALVMCRKGLGIWVHKATITRPRLPRFGGCWGKKRGARGIREANECTKCGQEAKRVCRVAWENQERQAFKEKKQATAEVFSQSCSCIIWPTRAARVPLLFLRMFGHASKRQNVGLLAINGGWFLVSGRKPTTSCVRFLALMT